MIGDLLKQQFGVEAVTLWLLSWFVDMTGCTIGFSCATAVVAILQQGFWFFSRIGNNQSVTK